MQAHEKSSGFALIEVLITLAVVLVGLTGVLRLQAGLLVASAAAKASDEAVALARAKLAELTDIQSLADYTARSSGRSTQAGQLHDYLLIWTFTQHTTPPLKQLRIEVRWPAADPVRHISLDSLMPALDLPRLAAQQLQL